MLTDLEGKEIEALSVVKYSHEATVRYLENGNIVKLSLDDIQATNGRKEYIETLRRVSTQI